MKRHRFLRPALAATRAAVIAAVAVAAAAAHAQSVPAATGSNVTQPQAQAALDFHNAKRRDVGSPPLQWSPQLAAVAQQWANHLVAANCAFDHTPNNRYGENLFAGQGLPYTALDASQDWYSEIKDFRPGVLTTSNWYATGHYTQMVWNTTTQVGIGQSTCRDGSVIIVAEYSPPGNYIGRAPY